MNLHYKFQKIADKVDHYQVNNKNQQLFSRKVDWVVTEKVHGTNFSIYYRDGQINFGKRNSLQREFNFEKSLQIS